MTVLIADDERLIWRGLQSLDWASIGVTDVYTIQNGVEAQELLLSTPIDLVIVDVKMPGMSELELAAMVKERSLDTAVVILAGYPEFEYARDTMRTGVYEYLLQPLAENSIMHGLENQNGGGQLSISIQKEGEWLLVSVSDTGRGMSEKQVRALLRQCEDMKPHHSIGLKNVYRRLHLLYGEACQFNIQSALNRGDLYFLPHPNYPNPKGE
ncbi:MAG: response regulator [Clostridiales bacterium]|nr:response regulator [Clostridiales bacterium]